MKPGLWMPRIRSNLDEHKNLRKYLDEDWLSFILGARLGKMVVLSEKAEFKVNEGLIDCHTLSQILDGALCIFVREMLG